MTVRQILREPLLHFLLIGAGLFVLHGVVSPGDAGSHRITVSRAQVSDMERQYQAVWGRAPTPAELRTLIDTHVHDELLYREGMAEGLGRDDPVIMRRIRQKLEVMAEEELDSAVPSDAALTAYLTAHRSQFTRPARVSFQQVYYNPQGPDTPATVAVAKARLLTGASPAGLGQQSMLSPSVSDSGVDLVARDFGADFAAAVVKLPIGPWEGPVASGVGIHLVRLTALIPPAVPPLAEIRPEVMREWENSRRVTAREASYRKLRGEYDVVVEGAPAA